MTARESADRWLAKTLTAKVTVPTDPAADEDPAGTFEAMVSVFGNTDSYGDVVEAGAFAKSLEEWAQRNQPMPVVWAHQYSDPDNIIGEMKLVEETDTGLRVKGVLDLDHPRAARIYELMKRGLIAEFSWSGIVREYEWIEDDDNDDWSWPGMKILDVDLWEAGPCFKGANPSTELLGIKTARVEALEKTTGDDQTQPEPSLPETSEPEPGPDTTAPAAVAPEARAQLSHTLTL